MESNHGAPQDGMGSETEGGSTGPGLGMSASDIANVGKRQGQAVNSSEAAGTVSDIAAKMAGVGKSTGSTLNTSNNVFN